MALISVYTFPALDNAAIAAVQSTAGAGNLILNGTLAEQSGAFPNSVTFNHYSRQLSLTSAANDSGVTFTITGTYRGNHQVATHAGPNANTVQVPVLFDTVTSVSVSGAVTNVSVGTGIVGQTNWFNHDYHSDVIGIAIQVVVTGAITYSYQATLDDVNVTATPATFNTILDMTNATVSHLMPNATLAINAGATSVFAILPVRFSNISVTAGTGSLVATFLQQGIR